MLFVAQRIHRLPETFMEERLDLASFDEGLNRFAFEHLRIVGDGIDRFWIEDEESAVDPPALVGGLLLERIDLRVFEPKGAEAGHRLNARKSDQLPMRLMEGDRGRDIDVGDTIAI